MKSKLKNFSLLTISTLIMAVGIYFFKFANNFTFGGITGIAVLVAKFLPISASDFSFVVNILLLIIGWIVLGKSFAEKTAYSTILLSVSLSLLLSIIFRISFSCFWVKFLAVAGSSRKAPLWAVASSVRRATVVSPLT